MSEKGEGGGKGTFEAEKQEPQLSALDTGGRKREKNKFIRKQTV